MSPPRNAGKSKGRTDLVQVIKTPLGFYVLSLLIVEGTLAIVLSASRLGEEHVWEGFLWMIGVFAGVIVIVTGLAIFRLSCTFFQPRRGCIPQPRVGCSRPGGNSQPWDNACKTTCNSEGVESAARELQSRHMRARGDATLSGLGGFASFSQGWPALYS